ncbi:MAG: UDP-3-O-(3-hydroxymyristoyl)glucosamine N-acyltransferase [Candidatus Velthaea sp.]
MTLGTLGAIAERTGGRVIGDAAVAIERIAAIDDVDATALTFATDDRYLRAALASRAAAILTDAALVRDGETYAKPLIVVSSVRVALADLLSALEPPRPPAGVHPSAAIDPSAILGSGVSVGPNVSVGPRAHIGDRTVLAAGAIVGADASIGADSYMHPHAMLLDRCRAGERVVLQAGATVGSDGFGWAFVEGGLRKIPQVGIVTLGDDVEIGSSTCVDRAQTGVTSIGDGTKIDNLCQIGHNSRIGKHSAIAAMTGMAGTTVIGDYVQVGGQAAFAGHITVGSRVIVAGGTHVWNDIPDGTMVSGRPARNHRDELRGQALLRKLPKLFARVDALESAATAAIRRIDEVG